ncbi:SMI1/KNR4 family protein [Pseudomonas violetae]|jgi:hypothetical protein|uniref:SMI1/KNR4 family protein n=1 Tax=Pseudomonas violetae TaxID=2915813 RepID=UPI003D0DECB0
MPIVHKPGLKPSEISHVEAEINIVLSVEYRRFLSGMNGFYLTSPDCVQIPPNEIERRSPSRFDSGRDGIAKIANAR